MIARNPVVSDAGNPVVSDADSSLLDVGSIPASPIF